ncbi:hypothetical protein TPA0906_28160 [Streptomyces olivaceus]|nr:hypothetical protein TPA0906_28160 [Streptomyces olivaceus]
MPAEDTGAERPVRTGGPERPKRPAPSAGPDASRRGAHGESPAGASEQASGSRQAGSSESAGDPKQSEDREPAGAPRRAGGQKPAGSPGDSGGPGRPGSGRSPESTEDAGDADDGITVRDPVSAPDATGRPRRITRRFPLFTRDTARPEGGGRAAARDAPAPARQWPVLGVVVLVGVGLLLTGLDVFRWGLVLVGAALLMGAALRWVVPDVGMLAVRSRFTDIATYGVLGTAIVMLSLMAQPDAPLKIPFLNDLLHFTVSS